MKHYYIVVFYSEEDACWIADLPELKYCSAHGDTPEQALHEALIAREAWLAVAREHGKPLPEPGYQPEWQAWRESEPRGLFTTKEAALFLGVAPSRIRQLILGGQLPAEKEGRDWWIKAADLQALKDRPGRRVTKGGDVAL